MLMVENEIYFPGWNAILISNDEKLKIKAISVNDVFRGWLLPPGNYKMEAWFEFPNIQVFNIISLVSLIIWLILLLYFRTKVNLEFGEKT
jgi:uncharacterized membrane protein YfhO